MTLVFIVCIVLAILGLTVSKNNIFSPSVITPVVWIVVLLLFVALPHDLPPLSWQFFGSLLLWVTMMCLGAMFTQCIGKRAEPTDTRHFLLGIDSNLPSAPALRQRGIAGRRDRQLGDGSSTCSHR